jgi:carboxypeptidase family protein/TonB-dependent receptor-like protein
MAAMQIGVAALMLATVPLAAQSPSRLSTVRGTVVDSLHDRPLAGASISVDGTGATAMTDSLGRYRIDSVPPGTHRIAVYHPLLDSLAVELYTEPMAIAPLLETTVPLALPSRATLLARFCGADTAAQVLVAGRLLDVDSDAPIAAATTVGSVESMSILSGQTAKIIWRSGTLTRTVKTDADGRFHLCMPAGSHYTVAASLGNSLTGDIPLDVATGIAMPTLRVSRADSAALSSRAALTGHVQGADGKALMGATIAIEGAVVTATTARDGTFHLEGAPSGTQLVSVRRVGFGERSMPVDLSSSSTRTVTVTLEPRVATLPTVDVRGEAVLVADAYQRTGFATRRKLGIGQFVTADQIARRNAGNATTLLEGIPGVRLQYTGHGVRIVSSHDTSGPFQRSCTGYLVDGQYVSRGPSGDDQFLPPPHDIIGIEVYQAGETIGGRAPSNCLTVLIWTKAMFTGD